MSVTAASQPALALAAVPLHPCRQWYFAQVFGASLGMNRRAWFPLTAEFWGLQTEDDRKLAQLQAMNRGEGSVQGGGGGAQGGIAQRFLSQDRLVNEQYLSLKNNELRTYKLSKAYAKTSALKEATLKMHAGEVFCLLGHNGAGQNSQRNGVPGLPYCSVIFACVSSCCASRHHLAMSALLRVMAAHCTHRFGCLFSFSFCFLLFR